MITERVGNLLEENDLTHIAHQANLYHSFGAGLAAAIRTRYPYALEADQQTPYGDAAKLGTYSRGDGGCGDPTVVNLYAQRGEKTDYKALRAAVTSLEKDLRRHAGSALRLGIPYRLGCGLGGGSWPKVYGILEAVFGKSPVDVVIVKLPEEDAR